MTDLSIDQQQLEQVFQSFNDKTVLVVGDVMLDAYWWGDVNRISPEAPVPVVDVKNKEYRLGGAANVALNLKRLGATPKLSAVIGTDAMGDHFLDTVRKEGMPTDLIIRSDERPTTVKTRVVGNQDQMIRLDEETKDWVDGSLLEQIYARIQNVIDELDAIVFVDYDKGMLTPTLIPQVMDLAKKHKVPTVVDPKKHNFFAYEGATLFKPNLKELREGLNVSIKDPGDQATMEHAVEGLNAKIDNDISFITLSEHGVYISNHEEDYLLPAHLRSIYDVSGAGDTVVSAATLALTANLNIALIAAIANLAGGLVCEQVGVVPINKDQLFQACIKEFS